MELPHMGDTPGATQARRKSSVATSASRKLNELARTRCVRPDCVCWRVFHSSMPASTTSVWWMAMLGPSASTLSSASVTRVAISMMVSATVSNPVISRSIQIKFKSVDATANYLRQLPPPTTPAKPANRGRIPASCSSVRGYPICLPRIIRTSTMGKRHLSLQQQRRILAGRRVSPSQLDTPANVTPERTGLVVARYGREVDVIDPENPAARAQRCRLRSHLEPVVGDRVRWHQDALHRVVVALEPRRSVLRRREDRK